MDLSPSATQAITVDAPISLTSTSQLYAVNIGSANSLTIDGLGNTLDGGSTSSVSGTIPSNGLFIYTGDVAISNLTIQNATATGGVGNGAGAGLGGGVFVASGASVTLDNVNFQNDQAQGGNSSITSHAGGGLDGGNAGWGGGGIGFSATGGSSGSNGGPGIILGAASGGNGGAGGGIGGANGGGGGSGPGATSGGGGGGVGGANGIISGEANPNDGVLGFGGGGVEGTGASGGFGGGTGEGGGDVFGGGIGEIAQDEGGSVGGGLEGGGLGAGGAIFVQNGGTLILTGNDTFKGDSVKGGIGYQVIVNEGVVAGAAGSDLFLMTGANVTLAPGSGNTITFNGSIADDSVASLPGGSTATGQYVPGAAAGGAITVGSSATPGGTVIFKGTNTYSGATTITAGTALQVDGSNANSASTVSSGALLKGTGTVGDVTVNSGGTIMAGDNASTLNSTFTASSLLFNSNAVLQFKLDTSKVQSDTLNVTELLTLDDTNLVLNDLASQSNLLAVGTRLTVLTYGSETGIGTGTDLFSYDGQAIQEDGMIDYGANQFMVDYSFDDTSVTLTAEGAAVPEPRAWMLSVIALVSVAILRSRARSPFPRPRRSGCAGRG